LKDIHQVCTDWRKEISLKETEEGIRKIDHISEGTEAEIQERHVGGVRGKSNCTKNSEG